ncbi:NYN domain-containing protein [Novosphingobium sp. CECT 9465]|uniref:NYN domain-containing protein n=1 Tax=Novosphingobium sp. CECT 9465 TaxID=2829794 RepID=UPI001E4EB047|nr:NYN domain-containing protein [Novosphingobium sp. CECT 9465]CAH0498479.1 hypothetical protein NVSP9465_03567 [Novosphingobium sp. CECT 9465]
MVAKSAILVDFDNVFITLWDLDRDAALRFASEPADWLQVLANTHLSGDSRRWLVARCYLNPAGYLRAVGETNDRLYFSRFRPGLVRAGFEVIDCPVVARGGKNAADIRIVIDALDLLGHGTRFDEFVLASGDSDFTPLLQRLRAEDRRITIISPGYLSSAYTALADSIVGYDAIRALVAADTEESTEEDPPARSEVAAEGDKNAEASETAFADFVRKRYEGASAPLNLAALALEAARALPGAKRSRWYEHGSFLAAVAALGLPHVRFSQHHLWDEDRHQPPAGATAGEAAQQPKPVELLSNALDLPRVKQEHWPRLFDALSTFAASNEFNLTEATRWCRDALARDGVSVPRATIGYVARGCQFGGARLDAEVPPSAQEIARAFLDAVIERAGAVGVALDTRAEQEIASWLGLTLPPAG